VVGGLAVVATIAAVVGVSVVANSGPDHPDDWDPQVADLASFVETTRGLDFDHPVYVDFLTEAEYGDRVRVDAGTLDEDARADLDDSVARLRALGLASGDVDLFEAGNDMVESGTLAFYDPVEQRVSVRGTEMTVGIRVTLVHELTHALQDQHFDLEALQAEVVSDATIASEDADLSDEDQVTLAESATNTGFGGFQALVEGDAVRVENAYIESLTPQEQDEYSAGYQEDLEEAQDDLGEVPNALLAFQAAPYALGQPLVDLVAADGGNPGVDAMFDDLPSTEEHMLDPLTYIDNDEPGDLAVPDVPEGGGETVDLGTLGAVEMFVILGERIDPLTALDAADGWANATFRSYRDDGDRTCVRILADGATAEDDQQMVAAFSSWAGAGPGGTDATTVATSSGAAMVDSCDPGVDGDPGNNRALDVLSVAAARSQVSALAVSGGADVEAAWASGNCFIHQLTFEQIVAVNELTGAPPPELQSAIDAAFTACPAA
jgi:hypothetical protein